MLIYFLSEPMYSVYTPEGYDYNRVWLMPKTESLEFDVVACSDIHIALLGDPGNTDPDRVYEIVIGGFDNTK